MKHIKPSQVKKIDAKEYYCENCFQEGLLEKEVLIDLIGNVFCSKRCREESMKHRGD